MTGAQCGLRVIIRSYNDEKELEDVKFELEVGKDGWKVATKGAIQERKLSWAEEWT